MMTIGWQEESLLLSSQRQDWHRLDSIKLFLLLFLLFLLILLLLLIILLLLRLIKDDSKRRAMTPALPGPVKKSLKFKEF